MISFFPALLVHGWWAYQRNRPWIPYLLNSALLVYGLAFFYSFHRITNRKPLSELKVGLVALAEKRHHKDQQTSASQLRHLLDDYSQAISLAAAQGAAIIVLPETAIRLSAENYQSVLTSRKRIAH